MTTEAPTPAEWRPKHHHTDLSHPFHRVLPIGIPRSYKVAGPDGKERVRAEMLVQVEGELRIWGFGLSVFQQLNEIRKKFPETFHRIWLRVWWDDQRGFPRVIVNYEAP